VSLVEEWIRDVFLSDSDLLFFTTFSSVLILFHDFLGIILKKNSDTITPVLIRFDDKLGPICLETLIGFLTI
jgi:hypothetical protein